MELKTNGPILKTLLISDLVESTCLVEKLGDKRAALLFARHDRLARDLLARHGGLEIDKADGFLLLFERPLNAVRYALEYHEALARLAAELDHMAPEARLELTLVARVGIHLGEIFLRHNPADDVARGAKPIEVEGLAKPVASRLMSLAAGRQTLITRGAFELARRASVDMTAPGESVCWLCHGTYRIHGVERPIRIYEVGVERTAPLTAPQGSEKMHPSSGEETLPRRWLTPGAAAGSPGPRRRREDAPVSRLTRPGTRGDHATIADPAMWIPAESRMEPAWTPESGGQELIARITATVTSEAEKRLAAEHARFRQRLVATVVAALLLLVAGLSIQEYRIALQTQRAEHESERASRAVETAQQLSRLLADLVAAKSGAPQDGSRRQQDRYGDAAPYGGRPELQPTGSPDDALILLRPPGSLLPESSEPGAEKIH